jgi:MFS superfamily sulfate permease-like transporter
VEPGVRTAEGLVVYRFGTSLYYANAARLAQDLVALAGHEAPLRWLVLDWAAIGDVDYTASTVLAKAIELLHQRHVRLVFSSVLGPVRHQLDRYGISADGYYDTPGEALEAFRAAAASLEQLGILLDVQQRGSVRGEQPGHGVLELVPAGGLDAGRSAQPGIGGPVRVA